MKTYVVTGASRGIGLATAQLLLGEGNGVIGTYNTGDDAAIALQNDHENAEMYRVDLADYASIDQFIEQIKEQKIDGIVNCAGIFGEVDFADFDAVAFERNFKVNTFAPVYLVSALQNALSDHAAIVNITSTDADVGSEAGMGYAASKAAITSVTKSMSQAFAAKKIRVNAIAPGWIGDGMQSPEELLAIAKDFNPMKRVGEYADIANVIAFLLSEGAAYINGTVIVVDGGDAAKSYVLDQETKIIQ